MFTAPRLRRLAAAAAAVTLGAGALTACGNKTDNPTHGETEGIYVHAGGLTYQVQISRALNPANHEDRYYLRGLPAGFPQPTKEETWFGIFVQIANQGDDPLPTAREFVIKDTQGKEYHPVPLDENVNAFSYEPQTLAGGTVIPEHETPAWEGPIQGSLLLYKLSYDSIADRPLELEIASPSDPESHAVVNLDV